MLERTRGQVGQRAPSPRTTGVHGWARYLIRRFFLMLLTLFGISVLIFVMLRLVPGNIADILFDAAGMIDPAEKAKLEHELGLDQPIVVQYVQVDRRPGARRSRLFLRLGEAGDRRNPAAHPDHGQAGRAGAVLRDCCSACRSASSARCRQNTRLDYFLRVSA